MDHPENRFHLVYGNKTPKDTMFYQELKDLEKTFNGRLSIQWVFSRANVEGSLFGRVEASVIKKTLKHLENTADKFYLCGPESMEITYDELTHKIENSEGKSVLDAALLNKLDVPYSCQGGVCSSCIARIKSGTAEMATNQILTDEEVEEGLILTCQAHATSSHLAVDYDDV